MKELTILDDQYIRRKNISTLADATDFAKATMVCRNNTYDVEQKSAFYCQKNYGQSRYVCSCGGDYMSTPDQEFCDRNDKMGVLPAIEKVGITDIPDYSYTGTIEFGEYPQSKVGFITEKILEGLFNSGKIEETGKTYTIDTGVENNDYCPAEIKEYIYKGEKYVRYILHSKSYNKAGIRYPNEMKTYKEGDSMWFRVEPVEWIFDEDEDIVYAKKVLIGGMKAARQGDYWRKEELPKTNLYRYLNKNMINELGLKEKKPEKKLKDTLADNYGFEYNSDVSIIDEIKASIQADIPIFLHGGIGEGKSSRVKQVDPNAQIIYLGNIRQPEELLGKTVYSESSDEMIDKKPTWLERIEEKCAKEPDKIHILFFDELTHAMESIQGYVFNIIQDREVNGKWKLPENVRIVAAGNEVEDSFTANEITEPLYHRFPSHLKVYTTKEEWIEWARKNDIAEEIISFIETSEEEDILRTEFNDCVSNTHKTNPRTWEKASSCYKITKNPYSLAPYIGSNLTSKFAKYLRDNNIAINSNYKLTCENYLEEAINANIPVLLHGGIGEGKSSRVKQIDPNAQIIYLGNIRQPEELLGKTVYNSKEDKMIDKKPTWLIKLEEECSKEPDKIHILFFDELTNALETIQGYVYNIIQDREVNGKWNLPENVRIVAAGNEVEDSISANELSEPLYHRLPSHVLVHTTVEHWIKWALDNEIHPAVISYIKYLNTYRNIDSLRMKYNDAVGKEHVTNPRTWEKVSKCLKLSNNPYLLKSYIGEALTNNFINFCNRPSLSVEDVLNGNYDIVELKMLHTANKLAICIGLCTVDEENVAAIREFIKLLDKELLKTFDSYWTNGDKEKIQIIAGLEELENLKRKGW